jgi:hypothetical protein
MFEAKGCSLDLHFLLVTAHCDLLETANLNRWIILIVVFPCMLTIIQLLFQQNALFFIIKSTRYYNLYFWCRITSMVSILGGSGKQVAREDTKCVTTFAHVVCTCYIDQAGNCTQQRRGSSATIATPNNNNMAVTLLLYQRVSIVMRWSYRCNSTSFFDGTVVDWTSYIFFVLYFCPYMFQPAWVTFRGLNASAWLNLLLITIY